MAVSLRTLRDEVKAVKWLNLSAWMPFPAPDRLKKMETARSIGRISFIRMHLMMLIHIRHLETAYDDESGTDYFDICSDGLKDGAKYRNLLKCRCVNVSDVSKYVSEKDIDSEYNYHYGRT